MEVPAGAADDPHAPLQVTVPTYRNDVTIAADLVEEVARMVGYDHIPETLLSGGLPPQHRNLDLRAGPGDARPAGRRRAGRGDQPTR